MNTHIKGFLLGAIAAATYGLNPLFALPLAEAGMNVDSILVYRYLIALCILGGYMKVKNVSFKVDKREILPLMGCGLLFSLSSLFLFLSYDYMDSGIASTVLFVYPVMVAVIMMLFFHEKLSKETLFSIVFSLIGIMLLYKTGSGEPLNFVGVSLVFFSALSYALYMVWIDHSHLKTMQTLKLTFYALLFGSILYLIRLAGDVEFSPIPSYSLWVNVLCLAIFPTIVSLLAMTKSIHYIGSTAAAILGALEPLTAIFFGVMVFGERLTTRIAFGVVFIIIGVMLVIVGKTVSERINNGIKKINKRLHS